MRDDLDSMPALGDVSAALKVGRQQTRRHHQWRSAVALLGSAAAVATVIGGATWIQRTAGDGEGPPAVGPASSPAAESHVPPELADILQRDNLVVEDGTFSDGMSPEESLAAFAKEYDLSIYEEDPTVYAIEIAASQESRLRTGRSVRMIHIPSVKQDVTGPALPRGSDATSETEVTPLVIETDLFAFLDAHSGRHLATVYIGPLQ